MRATRLLSFCIALSLAYVLVPSAYAVPPTLNSVGVVPIRHLTATWTLNSGESDSIEAATSPATGSDGSFFAENEVFFDILQSTSSSYVGAGQLPPGTFYVHVSSFDIDCFTCPIPEWSNVLTVAVPPDPNPPPPPPPPPPVDRVKPLSFAGGPSTQDIDKLFVRVSISEPGAVTVTGSVNVPKAARVYRLKSVTKVLAANVQAKVRLKLARKGLKAAKRAIKRGKKVRAKVNITATDSSGNETVQKRTIRLKR